ncbi:hypothetical protein [Salinigranum sp. GCM10025319]|uniref:hypothetical protein n=1 Tax=Salinigranum sp. GCM10025319 TaxID=3252687 RepID=UPI003607EDE9
MTLLVDLTTIRRLRQPEYTGDNRCLPCTAVNLVLAVFASVVLSVVLTPVVGVLAFAVSLAAIYLRGYLVPGTPELTKRYFPDWFLAWFDKEPDRRADFGDRQADFGNRQADLSVDPDEESDAEDVLLSLDAVEPCAGEDDLCLTDAFAEAWYGEISRLRDEDARRRALIDLFEVDSVTVKTTGGRVSVLDGRTRLARWPSEGALLADLAADRVLDARAAGWSDLEHRRRFGVLTGLRVFLEECPLCGGRVELGENTVESCCRSWDVFTVSCTACDTGLLEFDPETFETVA